MTGLRARWRTQVAQSGLMLLGATVTLGFVEPGSDAHLLTATGAFACLWVGADMSRRLARRIGDWRMRRAER